MSRGLMGNWVADWLGYADVKPKTTEKFSPFSALQQALTIVALIFAEPILKNLAGLSASNIFIIRLILIGLIIYFANHVVVAKELRPADGATPPLLIYKYSDLERLTSKIVLPLSLVVLAFLLWPEPRACQLQATVLQSPTHSREVNRAVSLEISGGGETNHYPVNDDGVSYLAVKPRQAKKWTITLRNAQGAPLDTVGMEGCPHGEKIFALTGNMQLVLRPY